ncbi:WD40 repeat domain-containing protein [Streptomyces kanamyceticus]|uniref:WD40 repeat domain-containing protein n=1 Tax=Streptomyces kanamyceticus TaxID=1967 RepID=UPI0006E380B7|nr:WD40 repeat domain-containing protein [Streptomyces kanamyceticus]
MPADVRPTPLGPPVTDDGPVSALAFDGRDLVTGTEDGTLRLWDVSDPAHPTATGDQLVGYSGAVNSTDLSPASRTLVTSSDDGGVRLWDLDVERVIDRVCAETGNALDRAQWQARLGKIRYQPPCP